MSKDTFINDLLAKELITDWSMSKASDFFKQDRVWINFADGGKLMMFHSKDYMHVSLTVDGVTYTRERDLPVNDISVIADLSGLEFGMRPIGIDKLYETQYTETREGKNTETTQEAFDKAMSRYPEALSIALAKRESRFMNSLSWSRSYDRRAFEL